MKFIYATYKYITRQLRFDRAENCHSSVSLLIAHCIAYTSCGENWIVRQFKATLRLPDASVSESVTIFSSQPPPIPLSKRALQSFVPSPLNCSTFLLHPSSALCPHIWSELHWAVPDNLSSHSWKPVGSQCIAVGRGRGLGRGLCLELRLAWLSKQLHMSG